MPKKWFGPLSGGEVIENPGPAVSVVIDRPIAREDMTGKRPFIVKKIGWRCCAAPRLGQKMYARASSLDGSVYDNSYIGNVISWQKAPTVTYEFQAINLHFADDGGTKIRAWLVSGGPFLYEAAGGVPVGYVYYCETALPPTGLTVKRATDDTNKVFVDWKKWNVKDDLAACGDTYSLSGYVVQIANNAAFSTAVLPTGKPGQVRTAYLSGKEIGEVYGLYSGYDWWFRIATRNEVSEHYKLPGGIWSDAIKLDADPYVPPTPSGTAGGVTGPEGEDADGDTGGLSGNNPGSTSNSGGTSGTSTTTETVTTTTEVVVTQIKASKETLDLTADQLTGAALVARATPTAIAWASAANIANAIAANAIVVRDKVAGALYTQWAALVVQAQQAATLAGTAATTAAGAQNDAQKLDAAMASVRLSLPDIQDLVDAAVTKGTTSAWRELSEESAILLGAVQAVLAVGTTALPTGPRALWTSAQTAVAALQVAAATALKTKSVEDTAAASAAAPLAQSTVTVALAATTSTVTVYQDTETAMLALVAATKALTKKTPSTKTVTTTTTRPIGTTTPSTSGDTTTPAGTSATATSNGAAVIWTPIPDTSMARTANGGLLVSRSPRTIPNHTVYLMDRGGRQRIGQFTAPTKIDYNRIRDDQSTAQIVLDGNSVRYNAAVLDRLSVGRHEILIYRGTERVWEGPITLVTWKRDQIEIHAKDITHYLNRTVMKAAYSNAYPNLDYVVNRIGGIIASELGVKEALDPPVNILPYMHTYVQEGDARTTRVTLPAEMTVWQHLDDLAAKAGIDYTVVGRSLYLWDTSRAALGRTRIVTEQDFLGDTYISAYGMELATQTYVTDGQGNWGSAGGVDDYYGEVDLIATAYDENGNAVNQDDTDPTNDTVAIEEMQEQAARNLKGRNPVPFALHVPDGSAFRLDRGLGLDVLIPGVYVPVVATLVGKQLAQVMKLKEIKVSETSAGESAVITLTPASATGDTTLAGDGDGASE